MAKITDKLTAKILEKLYVNQKMSSLQIAKIYHCDASYIRDLLRKHSIKIRTISEASNLRFNIPKETLENLYLEKKLSQSGIAKVYGCNRSVIINRLKKCAVKMRTRAEASDLRFKINIPKHKLKDLYSNQRLSSVDIANLYTCDPTIIRRLLKKHKIKLRTRTEARKLFYDINIPKKELRKLYLNEKLSSVKIAKKFNCNPGLILDRLREYEIPVRSHYDAHLLCNKPKYPQHDFSGDSIEKSYMIGFRQGDINAYKRSEATSSCIFIQGSSTKKAFIDVIDELFLRYGHIWKGLREKDQNTFFHCSLNKTFNFLLTKKDFIEPWILQNENHFLAFLSGYSDAEGSFCLCGGNGVFSIRSQDKNILHQIRSKLIEMNILLRPPQIARKEGTRDLYGTICNKDIWGVWVHRKDSLLKLIELMKPHIKHTDKQKAAEIVKSNVLWRNKKYNNRQDTKWYKEYLKEGIKI